MLREFKIAISALLGVTLLGANVGAQHGAPPEAAANPTYSISAVGPEEASKWREDLAALHAGLQHIHPDPFRIVSETEFDSAVAQLHADIPTLPAHVIILRFSELLALVGDGHTSLPVYFAHGVGFHPLPIRFGIYGDRIYVEAADASLARIVGGEVISIGNVTADTLLQQVSDYISRDNDNWIAPVAPHLLNRVEVLNALGAADDLAGARIRVRQGEQIVDAYAPALSDAPATGYGVPYLVELTSDWVDARDEAQRETPLYQRRFEDIYWWEYLPGDDTLYIKFDRVANRAHGPSGFETFQEALAFAREQMPAKTVIDIRNNSGGEGGILPPIIREIIRTREIDSEGKLYVVIGARTFSAAQMFVGHLERFTEAIFVGEPSGAHFNGPAGHEFVRLPHSGIQVSFSNENYQMSYFAGDSRRQATPDLAAEPDFDDYRANRDPAMDVILRHRPGALEHDLTAALESENDEALKALARAYDAMPENVYQPSRLRLNALGYQLMRGDRLQEAIRVFRVNVAVNPHYANGWDSLGEAYMRSGQHDEARAAFRRALDIDPHMDSARNWLERLESDGAQGG